MSRLDLLAFTALGLLLAVILLQTHLNKRVWHWYLISFAAVAIAWAVTSDWLVTR